MHISERWYVSLFAVGLAFLVLSAATALAARGSLEGIHAAFYGEGTMKDAGPGESHRVGVFYGIAITNAGMGTLHRGAQDCTGQMLIRGEEVLQGGGGYCTTTHEDGGVIKSRWEILHDGTFSKFLVKQTLLAGEGPYAGITGAFTWNCSLIAGSQYMCDGGKGEYRLP